MWGDQPGLHEMFQTGDPQQHPVTGAISSYEGKKLRGMEHQGSVCCTVKASDGAGRHHAPNSPIVKDVADAHMIDKLTGFYTHSMNS